MQESLLYPSLRAVIRVRQHGCIPLLAYNSKCGTPDDPAPENTRSNVHPAICVQCPVLTQPESL